MGQSTDPNNLTVQAGAEFAEGLMHFGVKGMKWGVRRDRTQTSESKPKEKASEDSVKAKVQKARIKTSGVSALSNAELQAVITRTRLEQEYAKLSPESVSTGMKFAKSFNSVAANAAKQVASQQVAKLMTQQLEQVIKIKK